MREKLAVSFALAQSVKLGVFERTVEVTIKETRAIPERMAIDGKIKLTRTNITKRIGQLFVDRASINLHSDILDHPNSSGRTMSGYPSIYARQSIWRLIGGRR